MKRFLVHAAVVVWIAALPFAAFAADPVNVSGGGQALVTDPSGEEYAASFAIAGALDPSGKARGSVNFVFGPAFGAVWGVFPDETDAIHVYGKITGITVGRDGTISLAGVVTEVDLSHQDGVIFSIAGEPFTATVDPDSPGEFIFSWCLLPVFGAEVTNGVLDIH